MDLDHSPLLLAAFDPATEVWRMVELLVTIVQPVLWAALGVGFLLATSHLLVMFVTRWGDKRVSTKSLLFSVAVHLSCLAGLVALIPESNARSAILTMPEEQRFRIEPVTYDEQQPPIERPGNTPVWQRISASLSEDLARIEPPRDLFEPDTAPERTPDPIEFVDRPLPDVMVEPDTIAPTPKEIVRAELGPRETAVLPMNVDDPLAEARDDVAIPKMRQRPSPKVSTDANEAEASVRPAPGQVDKIRPDIDPAESLSSINPLNNRLSPMQRRPLANSDSQRAGPAFVETTIDKAGESDAASTATGRESSPSISPLTRRRSQPLTNFEDGVAERMRPSSIPRSPLADGTPSAVMDGSELANLISDNLPTVRRNNFDPTRIGDNVRMPAQYRLRSDDQRKAAARRFGGTEASERAVDRSLRWLASVQQPDGSWDASASGAGAAQETQPGRKSAGRDADIGVTALAVLAYLGAGSTHEEGQYATNVERALKWLIAQQRSNDAGVPGYLGGNASQVAGMYCHAMATFALAEAYAMQKDRASGTWLRKPVVEAISFTLQSQLEDGGWRYHQAGWTYNSGVPAPTGDISMFGWQLMALKSAEAGGIPVPQKHKQKMLKFLKDRSRGEAGGLASYRPNEPVSPAMVAEALFCKQMLGIAPDNPASEEGVDYLISNAPRRSQLNFYHWYYGTLAMFQHGGPEWEAWNSRVRDLLVAEQVTDGPLDGSWDPRGPWGGYGGRIYSTALATLCLEVYYRYLPLYRLKKDLEPTAR